MWNKVQRMELLGYQITTWVYTEKLETNFSSNSHLRQERQMSVSVLRLEDKMWWNGNSLWDEFLKMDGIYKKGKHALYHSIKMERSFLGSCWEGDLPQDFHRALGREESLYVTTKKDFGNHLFNTYVLHYLLCDRSWARCWRYRKGLNFEILVS